MDCNGDCSGGRKRSTSSTASSTEDGQKEDSKKEDGQKDTFVQPKRAKVDKKVAAAEPFVRRRSERRIFSSSTVEIVRNVDDVDCNGDSRKRRSSSTTSSTDDGQKEDSKKEDAQKDTFVQPKGRAKLAEKVAAAEPVVPHRSGSVRSSSTVEIVRTVDSRSTSIGSRRLCAQFTASTSSRRAPIVIVSATTGRKIL